MKKSRFNNRQIVSILKEAENGRNGEDLCLEQSAEEEAPATR